MNKHAIATCVSALVAALLTAQIAGCSGRGSAPWAPVELPSGAVFLGGTLVFQLVQPVPSGPFGVFSQQPPTRIQSLTITNEATLHSVTPTLEASGSETFTLAVASPSFPDLPTDPEAIARYNAELKTNLSQESSEIDVISDPEAHLPGPRMLEGGPPLPQTQLDGMPVPLPGGGLRSTHDFDYLASVAITIAGEWGIPDPHLASASVSGAGQGGAIFSLPPDTGYVRYTVTGTFPKIADVSKGKVYRPADLEIVMTQTEPVEILNVTADETTASASPAASPSAAP